MDTHDDPVAMYLREVANVEPLSQDEETALFEVLRRSGNRNSQSQQPSRFAPLVRISPPENPEECLPQRELAARRLIEGHLQAVVNIVEKSSYSGVPMLELIQEGNIGLMKAIDRFAEQPIGEFRVLAATYVEDAIRTCVSQWK
jgi:DNA-directed RNA polymerase sigma subunit (sigma70/sigma32)